MPQWQQPFFQVALPIVVAIVLGTWYQSARVTDLRDVLGKRIDDLRGDMNNRFAGIDNHFIAIEKRLDRLESKVEAIQERSWR